MAASVRPIPVRFEDERLLIVDKPAGLLTVAPPKGERSGEPTLKDRLREQGYPVFPVHRLDRETSGLCVFAKSAEIRDQLMAIWKDVVQEKRYLAIVQGHPRPPEGSIRVPIQDLGAHAQVSPRGQAAHTDYRTVKLVGACALLELQLHTGRHNQARIHLAHIRHPLVGERKYAFGRDAIAKHRRCALHASKLQLTLPWRDAPLEVEAPLALDLSQLVAKLEAGGAPRPLPPTAPRRGPPKK
jgi:23S rRNA pseudouridine1911/1915/1917 synthase